jgi:hypothetical protein
MQAFTVSAAARLCGVDRRTLQRAIQAGRLPLDAQHCLSREALIAAGYLDAATPQDMPQETRHLTPQVTPLDTPHLTPQIAPQDMPQGTPQELVQATALLALLERLTTAITDLHEEVCSLREDLRQMPQRTPQERRRSVPTAPQPTPQEAPRVPPQDTPQEAPHLTPQMLGTYDPQAAAARMQTLRHQGLSLAQIAAQLTAEGVPTRYGLPWQHSSVRHLLKTYGK